MLGRENVTLCTIYKADILHYAAHCIGKGNALQESKP